MEAVTQISSNISMTPIQLYCLLLENFSFVLPFMESIIMQPALLRLLRGENQNSIIQPSFTSAKKSSCDFR